MSVKEFIISDQKVSFFFNSEFLHLDLITKKENVVIITDQNIFRIYEAKFKDRRVIIIPAGEIAKQQKTVNDIIEQLLSSKANRKTILVGIGGGVVTDITGYIGSIYLRGIKTGFVPTSLLAMVDASIGGKNGINLKHYKNIIGCIKQPEFILFDYSFLETLPEKDWRNGMAEVVKYACIVDKELFSILESGSLDLLRENKKQLNDLIEKCAIIKTNIVIKDEHEINLRRILNFGHTYGHAIENISGLLHGEAISIGMVVASEISELLIGFQETTRIKKLLSKYGLPLSIQVNAGQVLEMLSHDKKSERDFINYILLNNIGEAIIYPIDIKDIRQQILK